MEYKYWYFVGHFFPSNATFSSFIFAREHKTLIIRDKEVGCVLQVRFSQWNMAHSCTKNFEVRSLWIQTSIGWTVQPLNVRKVIEKVIKPVDVYETTSKKKFIKPNDNIRETENSVGNNNKKALGKMQTVCVPFGIPLAKLIFVARLWVSKKKKRINKRAK